MTTYIYTDLHVESREWKQQLKAVYFISWNVVNKREDLMLQSNSFRGNE